MKLEQSFSVAAPIEQVWDLLVDVERIAPCLPGAEITGVDESGAYQGTFSVKLGPTTAAYRGSLRMEAVDEAARTATMSAKGTDKRGQGGASATIVSTMREEGGETHVDVLTDFHITGRLARFGRSGMIEDISKRLMRDFAECLQATVAPEPASSAAASAAPAPVPPDDAGATPTSVEEESDASSGWLGAPTDATGAPASDAADAAVASAGGAASEAATAGSAPPGADELASGPPAPAAAPPAEPELAPARPGEAPEPGAPGTGPLEGVRAPGDPAVPPSAEPAAPPPETVAPGPAEVGAGPTPQPAPPAPEPAPSASAEPEPVAPGAEPEPEPRTGSIPPPGMPDRPAAAKPPAAKPISGFSLFFSVLWERIKRLFSRSKN
jgi:carbon monoxide dehydrogenase subunit G